MPVCSRGGRSFGKLAAGFIDGDNGVRPLVRIDSNDDHVSCLPLRWGWTRAGRRTHLSWGDATLLSSHVGRSAHVRRPAELISATRAAGGHSESQAAGRDQSDTQVMVQDMSPFFPSRPAPLSPDPEML